MTKPEQGKHARAKERLKAATLLTPAALTGVAIALSVGAYQPLVYDPDSIAHVAQAQAQELQTAEATSEKQVANDPVIESNFGMDIGTLSDGTYTGSARGYKSVITVSVTIEGGKIAAITIVSAGDDEPYFSNAKAVINRVLSSQSMNVDTVSGATYSSTGILVAIKNALLQAAGKAPVENAVVPAQQQTSHKPASNTQMPSGAMKDGVYTGSGMGFNDNITVRVTVQNGKIATIEIIDSDDDEPYFTNATAVVSRILSAQTTQVDAVTGATYSSKGIMAAVSDALKKAVAAAGSDSGSGNAGAAGGESGGTGGEGGESGGGSGGSGSIGPSDPADPNPDPGNPDNPSSEAKYLDGEYTAYAYCADTARPDRYEPYYVALTLVVKDGKIADIKNVHGSATGGASDTVLNPYEDENDEYLGYAANGRVRKNVTYIGVVNQLLKGTASASVDPVSGATYSSKAIAKAYDAALALAAKAYGDNKADVGAGSSSGGDSAKADEGSLSNSESALSGQMAVKNG